jgi:hypothetical protein
VNDLNDPHTKAILESWGWDDMDMILAVKDTQVRFWMREAMTVTDLVTMLRGIADEFEQGTIKRIE